MQKTLAALRTIEPFKRIILIYYLSIDVDFFCKFWCLKANFFIFVALTPPNLILKSSQKRK